jgi:hypothetical protein
MNPMPVAQPTGQPELTLRSTANVWGKKSTPAAAAAPAPMAPSTNSFANTTNNSFAYTNAATSNSYGGSSSYGTSSGYGGYQKTAEQIQKEKMAAALFGGISATQPPPPPAAAPSPAINTPGGQWGAKPVAAAAPTPTAPAAPAPAPVPVAAAPAPEVDLLGFDAPPAATTTSSTVDMLAPTALMDEPVAPTPVAAPPAPEPAAPPPPAAPVDPFADAGLLDGMAQTTLPSLSSADGLNSAKYEFGGSSITPLTINTPQFGERWGSCPSTHPISIPSSSSVNTLSKFMALCERAGLHKVEEIVATNEGIAACSSLGGSAIALVHGKISPLPGGNSRVDVTVKSTDPSLGQGLSLYLQI